VAIQPVRSTLSRARLPRHRNRNVAGCVTETASIRGNSFVMLFSMARFYFTGKQGWILFHSDSIEAMFALAHFR